MHSIVGFYNGKCSDYAGRWLSDLLNMSNDHMEKSHDFIQVLFPNRDFSYMNPEAPLLTDEVIDVFKKNSELKNQVNRSLNRMMEFYQLDGKVEYPWWCTKNNHNYLRITRMLHTLKAFEMQSELDLFYNRLMFVYDNNLEVIKSDTFSYWESAYSNCQEYIINVNVKVIIEGTRTVDVRAASLEQAKEFALTTVKDNMNGDNNYRLSTVSQKILEITAEESC